MTIVAGYVWADHNRDGLQDAPEVGLAGVTVELLDETSTVVDTTTTSEDGLYSFLVDSTHTYSVLFTAPQGYSFTLADVGSDDAIDSDANATTGETDSLTSTPPAGILFADAGLVLNGDAVEPASGKAAVGNRVWLDADNDGIQDAGELGLGGVVIWLYSSTDEVIAWTTSDSQGWYHFTDLGPDSYYLAFELPDLTYSFSPQDQGSDDEADSDVDVNGLMAVFTLAADEVDWSRDAGLYLNYSEEQNGV